MSKPARVSIVVVTYFPGETLDGFLDSLAAATTADYEVILADNTSTDGSIERAAVRPGVRVVATGGNLGFGGAANLGVAATDTDWVVVANPDLVFAPGALDALLGATSRWPRAAALGPLIRTPTGDLYPSARALPSLGRGIGHAVFGSWWPANPWTTAYRRERETVAERTAGWLSGSCLLLRREAFLGVSALDELHEACRGDELGQRGDPGEGVVGKGLGVGVEADAAGCAAVHDACVSAEQSTDSSGGGACKRRGAHHLCW